MSEVRIKGNILKQGEMSVERTAGTFRSPWVVREVVLSDGGFYVFEVSNARQRRAGVRGALLDHVAIESINGVRVVPEGKKRFVLYVHTFLKDHRLMVSSEEEAEEWHRYVQQALVGRRKQATVRGSRRQKGGPHGGEEEEEKTKREVERELNDAQSMMNESINALLHAYMEKRTQVLDELQRRELWRIREVGKKKKEQIQQVLKSRGQM